MSIGGRLSGSRNSWLAAALAAFACVSARPVLAAESFSRALRGVELSEQPALIALRAVVQSVQASDDCADNADFVYEEGGETTTCANLGPMWSEFCNMYGATSDLFKRNCPLACHECEAPAGPALPPSPGSPAGGACADDATWTDAAFGDGTTTCASLGDDAAMFCNFEDDSIATQVRAACPVTCQICQPDAAPMPVDCVDDPQWRDNRYGDGNLMCADGFVNAVTCGAEGPEARELRWGCRRTCNACEEAVILDQCLDDPGWTDAEIGVQNGDTTCRDLSRGSGEPWREFCFFDGDGDDGEAVGPRVRLACPFTCGFCEEAVEILNSGNDTKTDDEEEKVAHCSVWNMTIQVELECVSINPMQNYLVIPAYVLVCCVPICCVGIFMACSRAAGKRRESVLGDLNSDGFSSTKSGDTSSSRWSETTSSSAKSSSGTSRSERSDRADRKNRGRGRRKDESHFSESNSNRFSERTHQAHGTTHGRSHRSQADGLELTSVVTSTNLDHLLDEKLIATRYCYAGAIAKGTSGVMMSAAFSGTKGWECVYKKPREEEGVRVDETKSLLNLVCSGQAPDYGLWLGGVRYKIEDSNFQFQYSPGVVFPIWYARGIKHVKASWITLPQSVHIARVVTTTQSFIVCGFCEETGGQQGDPDCKLPYQWPPHPSLKCQGVLNLAAHLQATFGA